MLPFKSLLFAGVLGITLGTASLAPRAWAQTITFPQPNAQVRGSVKVLFEGVPEGGYAVVYLDGKGLANLREATTQRFHTLNSFELPDGPHTITIVAFNAAGKRAGTAEVRFQIANNSVDTTAESVPLRNWTTRDLTNDVVRRYRIFAESNASIKGAGGEGGAGGGGMDGGGGAGGETSETFIPAPMDWQIDMLVRRVVRDVGLYQGSANIRAVVQEAYQRQRLSEQGGGAESISGQKITRKKKKKPGPPTKAPWGEWYASPEAGRYAVKTIKQNGDEINATRKPATLGIADLLPRFPAGSVQPGSTWQSDMTIVGDIPLSTSINIQAPMTFVSFENIQTPSGVEKRTAKLEARFNLPLEAATRIARSIQKQMGTGAAGGGGNAAAPGVGATAGGLAEEDPIPFKTVTVSVSREIWFDIAGNQVLRATDDVNTFYEEEPEEAEGAVGGLGGAEGGDELASDAEGTKVSYNLKISKYLDDTVPPPTDTFNNGAGTAHSRDRVTDVGISRVLTGR